MESIGNPFAEIKKILTVDEIIDLAFSRSMKIRPPGEKLSRMARSKAHEANRINTASNVISAVLENIITNFPSLNLLHPFYLELAAVLVDVDKLKRILGRVQGVLNNINNVSLDIIEKLEEYDDKSEYKRLRSQSFARFDSILRKISDDLIYLKVSSTKLKPLPSFNPNEPCVVVTGFPNTGKSSFVRSATSGKPEIASYPFTTKKLIFGHRKFGFLQIQFVDTPGILDRPLRDRNLIELQAITALKHLADIMIYLIDISPSVDYSLEEQLNLMSEIMKFYPSTHFIPIISKVDLMDNSEIMITKEKINARFSQIENEKILTLHTNTPEGYQHVIDMIESIIKTKILKSNKFKSRNRLLIAEDQITLDDEVEDEDWYF